MTHDYKRHGTTTFFAAFDVLEGKVIGRCMQRHRHQEFIRFLNTIEAEVPAGKLIHVILDNYAAHKHPKVRAWLQRHERFTFQRASRGRSVDHTRCGHPDGQTNDRRVRRPPTRSVYSRAMPRIPAPLPTAGV